VSRRKSSRKKEVHTSSVNTADFMTSIQKIYSPEELLTLSKTLAKLTNLIRPPITTPPKVSELIPVMEILRLHLPLLSTLIGLYVSFFPKLFQDQWTFSKTNEHSLVLILFWYVRKGLLLLNCQDDPSYDTNGVWDPCVITVWRAYKVNFIILFI